MIDLWVNEMTMIRKLIRQMLAAQVLSALTVSVCLLIDNVMIARFLGEEAIAAYSLANPLLLAIGAIGSLLAAGVQVVCGQALGRGSQEEASACFSSATAISLIVSVFFAVLVLLFHPFLARIMGAGKEGELFNHTKDYLAGFSIGAPGSMGALVLVPFMQMAGQSGLLITAVLTMTVMDVGLDLLNVLVFHGGMFGMGLASAISYYAAMIVSAFYFLSKKSIFRFSRRHVNAHRIADLFRWGVPTCFTMGATVLMVYCMNRILSGLNGSAAVAAFAVIMSIGNSACCITTGIGGVSLTMAGILYQEEDRSGLQEMLRLLCRYSLLLGLGMGLLLNVFAPTFVSIFIPNAGHTRDMAVLGVRLFAAGLIPCCITNVLKFSYQATERVTLTEIISLVEGAVLPLLSAFLLSYAIGLDGAWLFFAVGELLTLLLEGLLIWKKKGRLPWKDGAALLLKNDFGTQKDQLLELEISSLPEVAAAARSVEQFCLERGQDSHTSNHLALCVEEMAANTIQHGFSGKKGENHLAIRVQRRRNGGWILRFRDDCRAFDPVHYVPQEGEQALGIRLVMAMAEEANYTYSMNLNNLMLKLPETAGAEAGRQP